VDSRPPDDDLPRAQRRRERQRAEIYGLVAGRDLHRAADLAHEHLAEFPDDHCIRCAVAYALDTSSDPRLRWRTDEFSRPG